MLVGGGSFTDRQGSGIAVEDGVEILLKTLCAVARTSRHGISGRQWWQWPPLPVMPRRIFFNTGGMRALTLHDPSTLTCFSNDYGYENAFSARLARLLSAAGSADRPSAVRGVRRIF